MDLSGRLTIVSRIGPRSICRATNVSGGGHRDTFEARLVREQLYPANQVQFRTPPYLDVCGLRSGMRFIVLTHIHRATVALRRAPS